MKTIVGIFAHPDDEALFVGGTLAKLAEKNTVYVICVTNGDRNGRNQDDAFGEMRKKELLASAKILGVKKVFFLEFNDGSLCNNLYHTVANEMQQRLDILKPEVIITFEPRGVSGHIDHIAVSFITSFVFKKSSYVKELWYGCFSDVLYTYLHNYFIYFPPGYKKSEVDKIVDISDVWNKKIAAMHEHRSQIKDVKRILKSMKQTAREEYFLVRKKS